VSSNGPGRNRLHPYEAGWLTLLVKMGVATRADATEAQDRVARQALEDLERYREKQRERKQAGGSTRRTTSGRVRFLPPNSENWQPHGVAVGEWLHREPQRKTM